MPESSDRPNQALCRHCGMPCPSGLLHCSLACEEADPEPEEVVTKAQPTYPVEGCYDDRD